MAIAVSAPSMLTAASARSLTDEVKADAAALWAKLLDLYEGGAHTALSYSSWSDYYEAEFGGGKSHSYRLLESARTMRAFAQSPTGDSVPTLPERVIREFAPLRAEPSEARAVLAEVVELHGPEPTAIQVREVVQSKMGVHYSSETDDWATPLDLFDVLDGEFGFDLDVCASAENAKCDQFFDREANGLAQNWSGVCWMNPPYGGEIGDWIEKAHASAIDGTVVVCLVPARTDTAWWWNHARFGEVRFLRGRLKFGKADTSAPFPSAVIVFGVDACVKWWEWR